jgi:hypothetical protein
VLAGVEQAFSASVGAPGGDQAAPVPLADRLRVEAYRFRRHLYYAIYAILVSTPSSYSEGVRYPSPFCIL